MWTIATYEPVSMTSLKVATATSTGGKSMLLPTPYAYKMALLNSAIQDIGLEMAQKLWPIIRGSQIAVCGPKQIITNNTFTKILKPNRNVATSPDTGLVSVMIKSIGFREYVYWQGQTKIALNIDSSLSEKWLRWMTMINYMGKRGGFVQATGAFENKSELDENYIVLTQPSNEFMLNGTLQVMDDCGPEVTFEQVDIYSNKSMKIGKDRLLRHIVLPYRIQRSSRGYTLYERIDS